MTKMLINFHDDGIGTQLFNHLMQAFKNENGYSPEVYDGYHRRQLFWESELTGWLSAKGLPCRCWQTPAGMDGRMRLDEQLPMGLEIEESHSTWLWII